MVRHLVKACWAGRQMRITIPNLVVRGLKWEDVRHVFIEEKDDGSLTVRRFVDGESLKNKRRDDSP